MLTQRFDADLIADLQSHGVRLQGAETGLASRKGGAGPTDHKAMVLGGMSVMVPVHTAPAAQSPFLLETPDEFGNAILRRGGEVAGLVRLPKQPRFYGLTTQDGVPYSKIAVLHGQDVLATTVLQSCVRYVSAEKSCQFCAIGASLAAGRTIERKTPAQLAEVAKAAVALDGVKHMVMTTGTPPGKDRGAAILAESAAAVKAAVDLPIQVQCEPPDEDVWFERLKAAGADALGMHLEAVTPEVRARIMPGKAQVPLSRYMSAFEAAVLVFGRGQVSTYILAGLGDTREAILDMSETLAAMGVYPFVVPFVPVSGTALANHPAPRPEFMRALLEPLAGIIRKGGLAAEDIKAGCGKCGACSALSAYERRL